MNECLRAEKGGDQHRSRKYQQNSKATKEIVATQRKKKADRTQLCAMYVSHDSRNHFAAKGGLELDQKTDGAHQHS